MRNLFLFVSISVIPFFGLTQNASKKRSINMGFHQTNSAGLLAYYIFDEGGYPTEQIKATFFDLNFLVSKHAAGSVKIQGKMLDLQRFGIIYGFGINKKGFLQKGMTSDGTVNYYEYRLLVARNYFSFYSGASYDFISSKKLKAGFGVLLNPDIDLGKIIQDGSGFKMVCLGMRSFAFIEYQFTKESGLRLSPYFQYALLNYYQYSKNNTTSEYRPKGFGFNVGFLF